MGRLEGQVAFVTGAARGQGRSHAIRLAEEGADVIAVDICDQIATVPYPMSSSDDLLETAKAVEATGRRVCTHEVDVRDFDQITAAIAQGTEALGPIDIVVANAGIAAMNFDGDPRHELLAFRDLIDVNLVGVWNTVYAAAPAMIDRGAGGSVIMISSTQGLTGRGGDGSGGIVGYTAAKHGIVGLVRSAAYWLSPHMIRVNSIHPTGVDTPMTDNPALGPLMAQQPNLMAMAKNLMPVLKVAPVDISNAVIWLASDEARYVTGVALPVDAGFLAL